MALNLIKSAHKERRKILAMKSLDRVPPSVEEAGELHQLYLNYGQINKRQTHTERVWMQNTALENCLLMFPQERKWVAYCIYHSAFIDTHCSVHGKIFGGAIFF